MKRILNTILLFVLCMTLAGCGSETPDNPSAIQSSSSGMTEDNHTDETIDESEQDATTENETGQTEDVKQEESISTPEDTAGAETAFRLSDIPAYSGTPYVSVNGIVDGNYLYNRCHLIGFQLTGENANTGNLITGTRYMNVDGMLPFENMVADYVKETGNHVMYRVTPIFEGDNLLASGVLMEAKSIEDNGDGILFNVYCYNVQPGIAIDYASGNSTTDGTVAAGEEKETPIETTPEPTQEQQAPSEGTGVYAVNANNGKIHMVGECSATGNGSNAMNNPVYFNTYEEAESYSQSIAPNQDKRKCGNCW